MQVLVIGSGGREHALAWKLSRSPRVDSVHCCPGNGGTAALGENWTRVDDGDADAIIEAVRDRGIDLVVIGPEAPLVDGLADRLRGEGIMTFGPGQLGSRLEGSKAHAKEFMARHGIPTAPFVIVRDASELDAALGEFAKPCVVKADGLAAGKGVIVPDSREEAEAAAQGMLSGESFGDAGRCVVLEERLEGVEMTMLVFVSGRQYCTLEPAQDFKPAFDGNRGPNTGGMGSYSPTGLLTPGLRERIIGEVLEPTLAGLEAETVPYRGILYLGLMITADGPKVIEYNVRFGDPETQPLLMRLETDLVDIIEAIENEDLTNLELSWDSRTALCLVLAEEGYPGSYPKGLPITGDVDGNADDPVQVFHAGTKLDAGRLVTSGGRVLGVTALGETLEAARAAAYERASRIDFDGKFHRQDIGTYGRS